MNVNELADELRKSIYEQIANINFHDVADFICQQQAEIEALKEKVMQNADLEEKVDLCKKKLEPVAELVLEQMAVGDASSLRVKWLIDGYPPVGTKLYTHPATQDSEPQSCQEADGCPTEMAVLKRFWRSHQTAKILTDEEILKEIIKELEWIEDTHKLDRNEQMRWRVVGLKHKVIAILKKASEK